MKRSFVVVLVVALSALVLSACAPQVVNPNAPIPMVNASGHGQVYLTPDVAYINIGVRSQAEKVADALKQNNSQATGVSSSLKELGVEDKDIQTSAFNVYPQQEYGPQGEVTRTVYVVENTVYVTVRDLSKLGQMLDAVVQNGANTINGISFDVLDKAKAEDEARRMAVEDARKQAQSMADAAGITLGKLISLNVYAGSTVPVYGGKGGAMKADAAAAVPVAAGQLVITMEANLSYEIK